LSTAIKNLNVTLRETQQFRRRRDIKACWQTPCRPGSHSVLVTNGLAHVSRQFLQVTISPSGILYARQFGDDQILSLRTENRLFKLDTFLQILPKIYSQTRWHTWDNGMFSKELGKMHRLGIMPKHLLGEPLQVSDSYRARKARRIGILNGTPLHSAQLAAPSE
jgi:hypothetical protein